ncbi:MAG: hypothetical protein BWK78_08140, partial [Thiotrichaceae bacterium IS1]
VFHPENLNLVPSKKSIVWWRGKPFSVQLVVGENLNLYNIYSKNKKMNPTQIESFLIRPALG